MDDKRSDALARAEATIAHQAVELERLRRQLADERLADDLRATLSVAAATGVIASPATHQRLLELIVETAAAVIGANAGSLFLVDEAAGELIFEVALGPKATEVKRVRVPLGHGVAGLVAISGQPLVISNAQSDARHAADIAQNVGYLPESILCVPLFYGDRTIGVLELLDKIGAASFSPSDIHTLGLFANQAAVAIELSRTRRDLSEFLIEILGSTDGSGAAEPLLERVRAFASSVGAHDAGFRNALELAGLVQEIAAQGESEYAACQAILRGFADYLRQRPAAEFELGRS
jgi:GAF domain-containing protein